MTVDCFDVRKKTGFPPPPLPRPVPFQSGSFENTPFGPLWFVDSSSRAFNSAQLPEFQIHHSKLVPIESGQQQQPLQEMTFLGPDSCFLLSFREPLANGAVERRELSETTLVSCFSPASWIKCWLRPSHCLSLSLSPSACLRVFPVLIASLDNLIRTGAVNLVFGSIFFLCILGRISPSLSYRPVSVRAYVLGFSQAESEFFGAGGNISVAIVPVSVCVCVSSSALLFFILGCIAWGREGNQCARHHQFHGTRLGFLRGFRGEKNDQRCVCVCA